MEERKVFTELLACVCRKDKMALRKMFSSSRYIAVNQESLSCDEAVDRVINNVGLIESKTDQYRIDTMCFKCVELLDRMSVLDCICRLNLGAGCGIWERYAAIFMVVSESRIALFRFNRTELPSKKYIIQANRSTVLLPEKEVRLLESCGNYILWHCNGGIYKERGVLEKRMKDLSGRFLAVRKSHCVNLDYVKSFRWHEMEVMDEKVPIIIPKNRYDKVKNYMDRWAAFEKMIIDSRIRE